MTAMLASVGTPEEAKILQQENADIIDLKSPRDGALGALPEETITAILNTLDGNIPVSATIGDLPTTPEDVIPAVARIASLGVNYVKLGFFPGNKWNETMNRLGDELAKQASLIAVFFAEAPPSSEDIKYIAQNGFSGIMLDTIEKNAGPITNRLSIKELQSFVNESKRHNLFCGLAGSLRADNIPTLLPLKPDYLGFRGALCSDHQRINAIDINRVKQIRQLMPAATTPSTAIYSQAAS